jgi:branched-chain amino acid transport system permease protein
MGAFLALVDKLRKNPWMWQIGLLLFVILLPLPLSDYYRTVAWRTGLYVILGLSLNVIVGYAGLFQLGHAAFFAIGAYTAALLNINLGMPLFFTFPLSIISAAIFAYLIAKPILHLRGDYLAIVSIAFGEVVRLALVNNIFGITGGANGLSGISRPVMFGFEFRAPIYHYYLMLIFLVLSIYGFKRLENSRLGRSWLYVREDEAAAEAMGIDTTRAKMLAFVIGSGWAGIAGALYAARITVISPDMGRFLESVMMFSIVVLGGVGSIPGVFVGALGLITLPELFRPLQSWRDAWMGVAMVVMMIARPAGIWPSRRLQLEIQEDRDELSPAPAAPN